MHRNILQALEGEHRDKSDLTAQDYGSKVIRAKCKVDIPNKYYFLCCLSSILVCYLVLLGNLLHEESVVTSVPLRPLAKPANDLPILLTEEQEFLFMALTEICLLLLLWAQLDLLKLLHYVGHTPIRLQVPWLVTALAHRASAPSFFADCGLLVVCSDAGFAECVPTVQAQGFCQELQADGADHLLLYAQQDS